MDYETTVSGNTPIAITIGNFDGIHRGHQRLLRELGTVALASGCTPVMVTFSPHTLLVVRPAIQLECLTTLEEKLALAQRYGQVANNIVVHFTPEVAALTAGAFLDIRSLVSEGQIAEANELLEHPVIVSGVVIKGDQRGRLLGFPTANLLPEPHKLLPANGVYAARVRVGSPAKSDATGRIPVSNDEQQKEWNSVVNVGVRPTFGGQQRLVEAHLLDVQLDLYDQRITINFIARLRNEQRFNGIDALKAQIAADAQQARQLFQEGG